MEKHSRMQHDRGEHSATAVAKSGASVAALPWRPWPPRFCADAIPQKVVGGGVAGHFTGTCMGKVVGHLALVWKVGGWLADLSKSAARASQKVGIRPSPPMPPMFTSLGGLGPTLGDGGGRAKNGGRPSQFRRTGYPVGDRPSQKAPWLGATGKIDLSNHQGKVSVGVVSQHRWGGPGPSEGGGAF
jgi:hypothetical protein